ncbi:MAG: hypothetical protein F4Y99_13745 [Acidimicrobiaceae bacterium]|nr:hypothetical protein [Acidimicrobiaceae bacterium]MYF44077.1 hypothetical protein [Acidimicrobiaceae bacterium]
MTDTFTRPARSLKQALDRQLPKRRDDSGLTTLEWLLIVAAVAGLAALAVVLVTNVISDTSEQIEGQSARKTAAKVAGARITGRAADHDFGTATLSATVFDDAADEYERDCEEIELVYSDVDDLDVTWTYSAGSTFTAAAWEALFADPETQGCVVT